MNININIVLLVGLIGAFICPVIQASTVPVIAWSNTRNLFSTRQISAGEEITKESLKQDFLDKGLGNDQQTIVLVLLNKLSLGDLTRFGDAYGSDNQGGVIPTIKTSMETATSSLVLPQTDTSELVEDLLSKVSGRQGEIVEITDLEELTSDALVPTKTNLLIVRIDPSESMEKQLAAADSYVKAAMNLVKGKATTGAFTVLFTAAQTSKQSSHSSGRRLLQSEDASNASSDFLFINFTSEGCHVFLYANKSQANLIVNGKKTNDLTLPTTGWSLDGSSCISNTSVELSIKVTDLKDNGTDAWISSLAISMQVSQTSDGYWYVTNETTITYKLKGGADTPESVDVPDNLETPLGLSYHCGDITFTGVSRSKANSTTDQTLDVYFYDFQFQPFNIEDDKFSGANECIGYFTPAIWMGIMVVLLIIAIIAFGISMMAAVRVMDKFDDPKGKQLVISVPES